MHVHNYNLSLLNFIIGYVPLTVSHVEIEDCHITTSQLVINVECGYLQDSTAIGFQVIAQPGVQERVHRLYVNQTLPGQTSASVEVEESGEHLVSVFPIKEKEGITDSNVEYREVVMVESFTSGIVAKPFNCVTIILLLAVFHGTATSSTEIPSKFKVITG